MRLLLDTHALIWFSQGSSLLSPTARTAMEDASNERYVSHATAWEIAIKVALGKLNIRVAYHQIFPGILLANGFIPLVPDFRHYNEILSLPFYHRDPFDRLLIAQAMVEGLTVVTSDTAMSAYGVPVLW